MGCVDQQREKPAAFRGVGDGDQQRAGSGGMLGKHSYAIEGDGAVTHPPPVGTPLGDRGEQRSAGRILERLVGRHVLVPDDDCGEMAAVLRVGQPPDVGGDAAGGEDDLQMVQPAPQLMTRSRRSGSVAVRWRSQSA